MAQKDTPAQAQKEPGRFKQLWQVFQLTRRHDKAAQWLMLGGFLLPTAIGIVVALVFSPGNIFALVMWIIAGVLGGVLAALFILTRRADRVVYTQIEGRPGAVGQVLRAAPRSWQASEMPVAVNPKTQDAIYRAVGRGGVALIAEGPKSRTSRLLEDEKRKVTRILPNVPVTVFHVGPDADSVSLRQLSPSLRKVKKSLTNPEVLAVSNRLSSFGSQLPIPKGVDPMKVRPQRVR
ncbi:DUF4191 domain-containing protein [Plantibacter sp. YIM 135249]|uniref:DUF4191 domain-containing protein n=1 Tax=Plantibacter sp. YIM 135249 TaxID=3423918 RepID=UPI003D33E1DF